MFNSATLSVLAFNAGKQYSTTANVKGQRFLGGFNVADAIGFARHGTEWNSAVAGAMAHIGSLNVITDADGVLA